MKPTVGFMLPLAGVTPSPSLRVDRVILGDGFHNRYYHYESGSLRERCLDHDFCAQRFYIALHNCEAQAHSAVTAHARARKLNAKLECLFDQFGLDSRSCIADFQLNRGAELG